MADRPWNAEPPFVCMHSGKPPQPMSAREAAESFCRCLERHILPDHVAALGEAESKVMALKQRVAKLHDAEAEKLDHIQQRLRRIADIIQGAQAALQPPVTEPSMGASVVQHHDESCADAGTTEGETQNGVEDSVEQNNNNSNSVEEVERD